MQDRYHSPLPFLTIFMRFCGFVYRNTGGRYGTLSVQINDIIAYPFLCISNLVISIIFGGNEKSLSPEAASKGAAGQVSLEVQTLKFWDR